MPQNRLTDAEAAAIPRALRRARGLVLGRRPARRGRRSPSLRAAHHGGLDGLPQVWREHAVVRRARQDARVHVDARLPAPSASATCQPTTTPTIASSAAPRRASVGPFNRDDLVRTNSVFGLDSAFPDLERSAFGFTVDPENPYRVLFFERWKGTNSGPIAISQASLPTTPCTLHAVHPAPCRPARSSLLAPRSSPTHHSPRATSLHQLPELPPTGRTSESPVFPFSVVWNPEGRIVYEHLTTAVDRFEGNTKGKVAVFGLLETAGLPLDNTVGNPLLVFQQKLNRWTNGAAQTYSRPGDVPAWWKSAAVGAEQNDM